MNKRFILGLASTIAVIAFSANLGKMALVIEQNAGCAKSPALFSPVGWHTRRAHNYSVHHSRRSRG